MAYAQLAARERVARSTASSEVRSQVLTFAFLLLVGIAMRGLYIGDPALGLDEDFYLLVGDRIWQGALPYVDIWDRKPPGLFLLYAAFRPFSSDGVVAYQVAALLFAVSTAFVIARIATRFVVPQTAAVGGVIYIIYMSIIGGAGGQSPVFYNMFMALAALLIITVQQGLRPARGAAAMAMLLVGFAMQIKTSAVVEGFFFGLWLLHMSWRNQHCPKNLLVDAACWVVAALLPTLLVIAFYLWKGHAGAFFNAVFVAALDKHEPTGFSEMPFLRQSAVSMAPILIVALIAAGRLLMRRSRPPATTFLLVWTVFAIIGFFVIGHFYDHYAQPALVPLSILCTTLMEQAFVTAPAIGVFLLWNCMATGFPRTDEIARRETRTAALVAAVAPYARSGCIYVNTGPPILYMKSRSCLPTPFVFPEHLSIAAEAEATGGTRAMAALIASKPSAVLFADAELVRHYHRPRNLANDAILEAELGRNYRLKTLLLDPNVKGHLQLFVRNGLP